MKKLPLRSKDGCQKCRIRHLKCDERRPTCGTCLRQGFKCSYLESVQVGGVTVSHVSASNKGTYQVSLKPGQTLSGALQRQSASTDEDNRFIASLEHPGLLPESPTSFIHGRMEKDAIQYLFDTGGTAIVRFPTQKFPSFASLNVWRFGLLMMKIHRPHLTTYLAIAGARLAKIQPSFEAVAIRYYIETIRHLRAEIDKIPQKPPSETLCAVAAHLSIFEMIRFTSPQARLAHFVAFHRLVEARLERNLPWGPFQTFLEFYIHCLSDGALLYFDVLVRDKEIGYIDEVLEIIEKAPRPLGREIVGVPKELTAAAYKIAFILHNDPSQEKWIPQLDTISQQVYKWQPPYHASVPEARGLLTLGMVYQMACMCLLRKVKGEDCDGHLPEIKQIVNLAASSLADNKFAERPFVSLGWPCLVLGIFAIKPDDRKIFQNILGALRMVAGLEGYRTAIAFLDHVWDKELGHEALDDFKLLMTVHI